MITARGCFSSHSFNQRHNDNEFVLLLQPRFPSGVRSVHSSAFRRTPPIRFSTNLIRTAQQRFDRCFTLPCFIPEGLASKLSIDKRKQCSECGFNPCFDGLGTSTPRQSHESHIKNISAQMKIVIGQRTRHITRCNSIHPTLPCEVWPRSISPSR